MRTISAILAMLVIAGCGSDDAYRTLSKQRILELMAERDSLESVISTRTGSHVQIMVEDYLASPSGQQFAKAMKAPQAEQDSIPSILTVAAWAAYYNFPTVPPGGEFLEFVFCPPDTGPLPDLCRLRAEYDAAAPNVPPQVAREVPIVTIVYVDTLFSDSLRMQAAGVIVLPDSTHAIGPWSQWSTRGEHMGCGEGP